MSNFSWKNNIPDCFGDSDGKFAIHKEDLDQAIELLQECCNENVSINELLIEVENYLRHKHGGNVKNQNKFQSHIDEQKERIRSMFGAWLP
jgi:hypothetical protein